MEKFVEFRLESGVGQLTLNRPEKRNALRRDFVEQICDSLGQLANEPSLRVLVITGNGKVFCAGMDLDEMQQRARSETGAQDWQHDSEVYCEMLSKLYSLPVPTVARIQGPALAGGVGLVLACDIVIASQSAFFSLPEPARGITAAMVTPLLIHRIGSGPATAMLLCGERISAARGLQLGLCHDVVSEGELEQRTEALVQTILAGAPSALAITKQHIQRCSSQNQSLLALIKSSIRVSAEARQTDDAREGLAAFLEKRNPRWHPS